MIDIATMSCRKKLTCSCICIFKSFSLTFVDWSGGGSITIDPIFFTKFHHDTIRTNDLLVAYSYDQYRIYDITYILYIGDGRYLCFESEKQQYLLYWYADIESKFKTQTLAKIYIPQFLTYNSEIWVKFHDWYLTTLYSDKNGTSQILQLYHYQDASYLWVAKQSLNDMYMTDLYKMYLYYSSHNIDPEPYLTMINARRNIKPSLKEYGLQYTNIALDTNRNAKGIFRDSNFSLCLVDTQDDQRRELMIFSFVIDKDGNLDIVQIGSNPWYFGNKQKYNYDECKKILSQEIIVFAQKLQCKKVRIMRWDKLGWYMFPSKKSLKNDFNLSKHQEQLKLIYNVSPIRQRKRKKTSGTEAERYSAYVDL